jgi:hypothetical protein
MKEMFVVGICIIRDGCVQCEEFGRQKIYDKHRHPRFHDKNIVRTIVCLYGILLYTKRERKEWLRRWGRRKYAAPVDDTAAPPPTPAYRIYNNNTVVACESTNTLYCDVARPLKPVFWSAGTIMLPGLKGVIRGGSSTGTSNYSLLNVL